MNLPLPALPEQRVIDDDLARRLRQATAVQRALHQLDGDDLPMFSQAAPHKEPEGSLG